MIVTASTCRDCQSSHLILNGKTQAGNQRYKCKDCGSTKVLQLDERYSAARQELVAQTYVERNSSRSVGRLFGISHRTVLNWLKKSPDAAAPENHLGGWASPRSVRGG